MPTAFPVNGRISCAESTQLEILAAVWLLIQVDVARLQLTVEAMRV
jgi:hypothetical protein